MNPVVFVGCDFGHRGADTLVLALSSNLYHTYPIVARATNTMSSLDDRIAKFARGLKKLEHDIDLHLAMREDRKARSIEAGRVQVPLVPLLPYLGPVRIAGLDIRRFYPRRAM